ncbi:hypothetical protein C4573_03225 [Candidatus Woesearchaeota archaeon]|nr:MAG: hypothetical protein C4573_03225 [Candidatus Woesearchaeota archaeon]
MLRKTFTTLTAIVALTFLSCGEKHFFPDYFRGKVGEDVVEVHTARSDSLNYRTLEAIKPDGSQLFYNAIPYAGSSEPDSVYTAFAIAPDGTLSLRHPAVGDKKAEEYQKVQGEFYNYKCSIMCY